MKLSEAGLHFIGRAEGCRIIPYPDIGGRWTIGFGHLIKPGEVFHEITMKEAYQILSQDVQDAETIVDKYVKTTLTQGQYDSLVSFVFNIGPGRKGVKDGFVTLKNGNSSSLLKYLNAGNFKAAALEFPKWNKDSGKVVSGLTKRRLAEQRMFNS